MNVSDNLYDHNTHKDTNEFVRCPLIEYYPSATQHVNLIKLYINI